MACRSGEPERFPGRKRKAARPVRHGLAHWIERGDCVWLVRRPAKGMLGGMAALPGREWTDAPEPAAAVLARVTHLFTHLRLELAVAAAAEPTGEGWWQPLDRLDQAGLPTLYRRAAQAVLAPRLKAAA